MVEKYLIVDFSQNSGGGQVVFLNVIQLLNSLNYKIGIFTNKKLKKRIIEKFKKNKLKNFVNNFIYICFNIHFFIDSLINTYFWFSMAIFYSSNK